MTAMWHSGQAWQISAESSAESLSSGATLLCSSQLQRESTVRLPSGSDGVGAAVDASADARARTSRRGPGSSPCPPSPDGHAAGRREPA